MSIIEEFLAGRSVARRENDTTTKDPLETSFAKPYRGRNIQCGQPECTAPATKLVVSRPCGCCGRFCVSHAAAAVTKAEQFVSARPAGHPANHPKCGARFVVGDWRLEVIAL